MKKRYIKTLKDFERQYFPKSFSENEKKNINPERIGSLWAKDTMDKLKKNLKIFKK